jgi:hypothetical protein
MGKADSGDRPLNAFPAGRVLSGKAREINHEWRGQNNKGPFGPLYFKNQNLYFLSIEG